MANNEQNFSGKQLTLINATEQDYLFQASLGDYVRITLLTENKEYSGYEFYSNKIVNEKPEVELFNFGGNITIKPNEVLDNNYVSSGNYILKTDFLRNIFSYYNTGVDGNGDGVLDPIWIDPSFIIKEISPSRREVRLVARNQGSLRINLNENEIIEDDFSYTWNNALGTLEQGDTYPDYSFDWVLTIRGGENIPITNTTFDHISDTDYSSIIIRLNYPLPQDIVTLATVGVEKELSLTQTENIMYRSNVDTTVIGSDLEPHWEGWSDENSFNQDFGQNYDDLIGSSSISEVVSDDIVKSQEDINLNVDYNEFKNHIFFGSAESKLANFNEKVGKIQGYLSQISASLIYPTGSYTNDRRKFLFNKIREVKSGFTPYEEFLYNDAQSQTTMSAPSLGTNYAFDTPVQLLCNSTAAGGQAFDGVELKDHEGFRVVYKHRNTGSADDGSGISNTRDIFTGRYNAAKAPFFNYSGSVWLSFLLKGDETIGDGSKGGSGSLVFSDAFNEVGDFGLKVPKEAYYQSTSLAPLITSSQWQRYIFQASQSYWQPTGSSTGSIHYFADVQNMLDNDVFVSSSTSGNYYKILSSSAQIVSASDVNASRMQSFPISLPNEYAYLGSHLTASNVPFTGSVLPSGDLFNISFYSTESTAATQSFITDVRISLKNPDNALPFSHMYLTSSADYSDWYSKMLISASAYDNENIHSLKNNLPEHFKVNSDYDDMHTFINLWGEHFDGVRNYIDTYKTFYNRGYNNVDSVPSNLLPIITQNLGWELINPFSSSLSNYFSSLSGSHDTIGEITNKTWRKVLNNLIYIYKSKGTQNSLRALLNVYGYPPDMIPINEFGGSLSEHNPVILDNTIWQGSGSLDLETQKGNISFIKDTIIYDMVHLSKNKTNSIKSTWQSNGAFGDGIEFNFVPKILYKDSWETSSLVVSSGSGLERNWELFIEPYHQAVLGNPLYDAKSTSARLTLRIKSSGSADKPGDLSSGSISASTDWFDYDPETMYNIYVGSVTSSVNASTTEGEYRVRVMQSKGSKFNIHTEVTASATDVSWSAGNVVSNFKGTGSLSTNSTNNLHICHYFDGDVADIKFWKNEPSRSVQKQHTFNPPSIVGNNVNSYDEDIIYHFKLNEGYKTGSASTKDMIDASFRSTNINGKTNQTHTYDFDINQSTFNKRIIETIKFVPRTDGISQRNDKKIITDPEYRMERNLNPHKSSEISHYDKNAKDKRKTSRVLDISKSPSQTIDSYITNVLSDKDISQYFSSWGDLYEPSYSELDSLRKKLFADISIDINEYIRAQSKLFNPFLINAIKSLVPVRSKLLYGVRLEPTILERPKYEYKQSSTELCDIYIDEISILMDFSTTEYISPITNVNAIDFINDNIIDISSTYDDNINLNFTILDSLEVLGNYINPTETILPTYTDIIFELITPTDFNIDTLGDYILFTADKINPYTDILDIHGSISVTAEKSNILDAIIAKNETTTLTELFEFSALIQDILKPNDLEMATEYTNFSMEKIDVKNGTIDFDSIFLQQWVYEVITNLTDLSDFVEVSALYKDVYELTSPLSIENDYMDFSFIYEKIHDMDIINTIHLGFTFNMLMEDVYNSNKISLENDYIDLSFQYQNIYEGLIQEKINSHYEVDTAATVTWTFTDKCNEESTVTLTDATGRSHTFEVDNDGDGAVTAGATPMDPPTNNAAGMGYILASSINASPLRMSAHNPTGLGAVAVTQYDKGAAGNTTISYSDKANWDYNNWQIDAPSKFTGGSNILRTDDTDASGLDASRAGISDLFNFTIDQISLIQNTPIDFLQEYLNYTMEYKHIHTSQDLSIPDSFDYVMEFIAPSIDSINLIDDNITISTLFGLTAPEVILDDPYFPYDTFSFEYIKTKNIDYQPFEDNVDYSMEYIPGYSDTVDVTNELQLQGYKDKKSPLKTWGTSVNSTWIMNMAWPGDNSDYNTGIYDDHVISYAVGDFEYTSESKHYVSCSDYGITGLKAGSKELELETSCTTENYCDASDYRCHHGREVWDSRKSGFNDMQGNIYYSYFGSASINPTEGAPIEGKPIGRTTFITTGSDGQIKYPKNHWKFYHTTKDQMPYLFYDRNVETVEFIADNGSIGIKPQGLGDFPGDLFPTSSFYSIEVEGSNTDNILQVQRPGDRKKM